MLLTKKVFSLLIILVIGIALGLTLSRLYPSNAVSPSTNSDKDAKQPLYWVAPMDANYRRDKPGKSPMGMDLIPVYQESQTAENNSPATVRIAPQVVNNLGVRTQTVSLKPMVEEIFTVGYVQYDQDRMIHIHPRVDGWIEKLFVKAAGDPVTKGQALYTLYSPQLVNAQEEFLIALKRNNSSLIVAAKERLRALQLSSEFIKQLQATQEVQQTVTFYSPQAGVVDGLKIREGFYVTPGTTLLSIAQLEQVWVEAEVFERDSALIKSGLQVTMKVDYLPSKSWQGVVDYVYPTLNSKTRTLRVRLKFNNPQALLKPNMFAQVAIVTPQTTDTLLVPKEAVIRTGKQNRVVQALGQGQFKSVAVSIGRVGKNTIEILSGLNEGDEIVTSAQFLIDSESSKSADFQRMAEMSENTVTIQGQVNDVMMTTRVVNISHQPVQAWGWPEMTMDFSAANTLDLTPLQKGQTISFEVTKTADAYQITAINNISEPEVASATVDGIINHINHAERVVNISREAIEKWQRPATTMDFYVAEHIDLTAFSIADKITFTFEIRDDFIVVELFKKSKTSAANQADSHSKHTASEATQGLFVTDDK